MSQQNTPGRLPRSSPGCGKQQGPMKATIPMSSVVKQSNLQQQQQPKNRSPTLSPTASCWKTRAFPDNPGQRSPGSTLYKVKSRIGTDGAVGGIRRTASLDTLYLRGHWPRDGFYWHIGMLQVDKATQTDESDWTEASKITQILENEDKLEKLLIRQRLQRSTKDSNGRHTSSGATAITGDHSLSITTQTTSTCIFSTTAKANPINIPAKPLARPTIRSSIEGLNQEIEGLVLESASSGNSRWSESSDHDKVTPEGHRAPLADLFRHNRSRSVNTQTPTIRDVTGSCHSSGGSQGSSPSDQEGGRLGTSPHINRFLAREPPDGCEKVHLKTVEEQRRSLTLDHVPQPCTFRLRPSLGSAFQILQPGLHQPDNDGSEGGAHDAGGDVA